VHANQELPAFLELESAIQACRHKVGFIGGLDGWRGRSSASSIKYSCNDSDEEKQLQRQSKRPKVQMKIEAREKIERHVRGDDD
jgi:hypothetical protein